MSKSLLDLPVELQLKIFSYITSTHILLKIAEAVPRTRYLLSERNLFKSLNFYKAYGCEISHVESTRYNLVTFLNINCVYWISGEELRRCLINLNNLKTLYAMDTKLSFSKIDCVVYSRLSELTTIAASIKDYRLYNFMHYPDRITKLYVQVNLEQYNFHLQNLITHLTRLEEFWIIDSYRSFFNTKRSIRNWIDKASRAVSFFNLLELLPSSITKFTCKVRDLKILELPEEFERSFKTVYNSKGCVTFVKNNRGFDLDKFINDQGHPWRHIFQNSNKSVPFGVRDVERLANGSTRLSKIQLEEINLSCIQNCKCGAICGTVRKLIKKNLKLVKKMSLPGCFCVKSAHVLQRAKPQKTILEQIGHNCRLIQELEVWQCVNPSFGGETYLAPIEKMQNLTKLTLVNVVFGENDRSLRQICAKCPKLTSLKINTKTIQNPNYFRTLCDAILETKVLSDFKLHVSQSLSIVDIFDAFNSLASKTIERISINCDSSDLSLESLRRFLDVNSQLIFFYIHIVNVDVLTIMEVVEIVKLASSKSPNKVFVVDNYEIPEDFRIPSIHKHEMIWLETNVGVVDIFNGFSNSRF